MAALGIGALGGSATAWKRFETDFRGCSEVWLIVAEEDLEFDPPAVAHVIHTDGETTACKLVEFTPETATTIPGQYGDAPVIKVEAPPGEKILAVIEYNMPLAGDGRFSRPRCASYNDHQCAHTPNIPDIREADCFQEAREIWEETDSGCPQPPERDSSTSPGRGNGQNNNSRQGRRSRGNGRGRA